MNELTSQMSCCISEAFPLLENLRLSVSRYVNFKVTVRYSKCSFRDKKEGLLKLSHGLPNLQELVLATMPMEIIPTTLHIDEIGKQFCDPALFPKLRRLKTTYKWAQKKHNFSNEITVKLQKLRPELDFSW